LFIRTELAQICRSIFDVLLSPFPIATLRRYLHWNGEQRLVARRVNCEFGTVDVESEVIQGNLRAEGVKP
jgi:hypothetical protein